MMRLLGASLLFLLFLTPAYANHTTGHYQYTVHKFGTKDFTLKSGSVNIAEDLDLFEWLMYSADEKSVPAHSFIEITRSVSPNYVTISVSKENGVVYASGKGSTLTEASRKLYYEIQRQSRRMASEPH